MVNKSVTILSASIRENDRMSHRVSLFLKQYIEEQAIASVTLLDLKEYNFPLFPERLAYLKNPSGELLDFTRKMFETDALIIVTPVYNGSYPASLKNVIDLYFKEWKRKIVAVAAVTDGMVPPLTTVKEVQALMLKLGALVSPVAFTVINAPNEFSANGNALYPEQTQKLLNPFIDNLTWLTNKIRTNNE